jgi:hypothetical protein
MPGLAALAVFPNLAWGGWAHSPPVPALFSPDLVRACLGREANVLAFPFGTRGDTLLWQVESNFAFRLAGGYIDPTPPPQFSSPRAVQEIAADDLPPKVTVGSLRTFVRLKRVTVIVLAAREEPVWRPLLARLARPQAIGAVLIYRLSRSPSSAATACSKAWLSNPQS